MGCRLTNVRRGAHCRPINTCSCPAGRPQNISEYWFYWPQTWGIVKAHSAGQCYVWTAWYYLVSWFAHCPYFPLPSPVHIFMNLLLVITIKTNVSVQSVCGACSDHMSRECGVLFYHIYLQTFFTQLFMALGSRSEETISSSLHYIGKFPTQ